MAAVFITEVGGDVVLHLNVVIPAKLAEAGDLIRHPEEPLVEVEIVRALIQQHPAAFPFPAGPPPAAGVVGVGPEPIGAVPQDAADFPQFALFDEAFELFVERIGAELEHRPENLFTPLVRGDEPLAVRLGNREGFFHHDVQPGFQRGDAHGSMEKVRGGDQHGINGAGGDHLLEVAELMLPLFLGRQTGGLITNGGQLQSLHLPRTKTGPMGFSHVSKPDETNSDVFHKWRIMSGIRGFCQFPGWVMDYQLRILMAASPLGELSRSIPG